MINKLIEYMQANQVLDKSPREALLFVANHVLAHEIIVTPDALKRALCKALPERGEALFNLLGVRTPYPLAALCYLALYDNWLCYAMCLTLEMLLTNRQDAV
jgi:hypothetical protein